MEKSLEQLFNEREKRVADAITLKIPDRVPVQVSFNYFPARYTGITTEAAYYDYDAWLNAFKKCCMDFHPDVVFLTSFFPGKVLEMLDPKQMRWPGHGVSPHHSHQSIEVESMMADEYDSFLGDLSDHVLRYHIPRVCGTLEALQKLPQMSSVGFGYRSALALADAIANPEVFAALETLRNAGLEMNKWRTKMAAFGDEIEKIGFPLYSKGAAGAPFDAISDNLRGMSGTMLDMYRQPEKLLEAVDKVLQRTLTQGVAAAKRTGHPRVFMALHRGADGFMSLKQFEKFYWPSLKKVILALVDEGLTPCVFFEGDYTQRLEYLLELPKGKVLAHFDSTDIFKAKEILGGHLCFRGNVPSSLLQTGTPEEVKAYCKKLIDVVGKDGGLIVSPRSSIDEVKPENLHAMIDFTQEYGVYN